jgi:hypothetical protein
MEDLFQKAKKAPFKSTRIVISILGSSCGMIFWEKLNYECVLDTKNFNIIHFPSQVIDAGKIYLHPGAIQDKILFNQFFFLQA